MSKPIQIFKTGKHTALSGIALQFSESDLKACAAAYDPKVFKAPLVIGHPKLEDPAYGWVNSLDFSENILKADPEQVDPQFAELVNDGRFSKVSAAFYTPDSPNNPKPGVLYLKHVGFLGAAAPAVKGLPTVSFSESEQGVVEFADWDQMTIASLFRGVREFIISKFDQQTADQVLPSYQIDSLQISAVQDVDDNPSNLNYSESETPMTPEEKAKMEKLEAENAAFKADNTALKTQLAEFSEAETKRKNEATHASNVEFCEGLIKAGKLLPASKDATISTMDNLANLTGTVEFAEGETKSQITHLDAYKRAFEKAPAVVQFSEAAPMEGDAGAGQLNYQLPRGGKVDQERLNLHLQALEFAEKHNCDYVTAVTRIEQSQN